MLLPIGMASAADEPVLADAAESAEPAAAGSTPAEAVETPAGGSAEAGDRIAAVDTAPPAAEAADEKTDEKSRAAA